MKISTGISVRQLACALLFTFIGLTAHGQIIKAAGSLTVCDVMKDAVAPLKVDAKIILQVSTEGGSSSWGIYSLGLGFVDIALSSRHITAQDRAQYPDSTLQEFHIGEEATSVVVSSDVWNGGVKAITAAQARAIYEGRIKNWKELGGPDLDIVCYTPVQSRGVWACYATWIYDDLNKMRPNRFALVGDDEEAREDMEATPGSMTLVATPFAISKNLHQLALKNDDGTLLQPTAVNVANHTYPLCRPILLVIKNKPVGDIKTIIEFMTGDKGQTIVRKFNHFALEDLKEKPEPLE